MAQHKAVHPVVLPAGFRPEPWARAAGISRSGYYTLPPDTRPRSVTVGRRRIITESPADWLARIGGA
jgi:hypothetical protein